MVTTEPREGADGAAPEQRAAEWLARLQAEDCSDADWRRFCEWRDADSRNEAAFTRYAGEWSALGELAGDPAIMQMRLEALAAEPERSRPAWLVPLAASIALMVAVGLAALSYWTGRDAGREGAHVAAADAPAAGPAEAGAGQGRFAQRYRSAVGERSRIDLPDGSTLELNTDTLVEVDFGPQRRALRLVRGEALFEVERDPGRPFVVTADDERVIALGTVFSVRTRAGEVVVSLIEGAVQVDRLDAPPGAPGPAARSARLAAGQQLVSRDDAPAFQVSALDEAKALGWRSGRLVFDDDRLGDVVADLNRYTARKITLGDAELADMRVSGAFRTGSAETFARALSVALPITSSVDEEEGAIVLRAQPESSAKR